MHSAQSACKSAAKRGKVARGLLALEILIIQRRVRSGHKANVGITYTSPKPLPSPTLDAFIRCAYYLRLFYSCRAEIPKVRLWGYFDLWNRKKNAQQKKYIEKVRVKATKLESVVNGNQRAIELQSWLSLSACILINVLGEKIPRGLINMRDARCECDAFVCTNANRLLKSQSLHVRNGA